MFLSLPSNALADPRPYPHYHQYYEPATPFYYPNNQPTLSEDFTLIVKFELEEDEMKYSMPGFYVQVGGEEQYINGNDFEDDGKAKVTFVLDRDDLAHKEIVTMSSDDNRYSGEQYFRTDGLNSQIVKWELLD